MNTNKLKRFGQEARKKLIEQIGAKLEYVLTVDTAELREKQGQVKALKEELNRTGKAQLVEKVAYTWFNRLVALRFMDVNGFQPLDLRIISPKEAYTFPELLDEAKQGNIPEDLKVNAQQVYDLLDGRVPSANPQNEAYKVLLIAACNHLHTVLPFLFERINDYTELLLPDDLTSEFSIVHDVREGMAAEDCQQVEIIGWLYQFYISEKKDEVFASNARVKKEDIPAATQLFTPRWVVEYMVQNTVGKLWLQNRPNSRLREHMPYFIESASLQSGDYLKINSPEEITLLDQACGSGHILVYGFELLTKIYEEEGYSASEIPKLIIQHNLYGFEIDERAAQLAAMALMMKARSYQRRFFKKGDVPQPHILCFQDLTLDEKGAATALASIGAKPSDELLHDLKHMRQATNLGSLIVPHAGLPEIENVLRKIEAQIEQADMYQQHDLLQMKGALGQLTLIGQKYACIVDNPPYMGARKMNPVLSKYINSELKNSRADLMGCFMERAIKSAHDNGFISMINFQSWMFLSSFEDLRKQLLKTTTIDKLLHIGRGVFGSDSGTVVFVLEKKQQSVQASYFMRLFEKEVQVETNKIKEQRLLKKEFKDYTINQSEFLKLPGQPISYWISKPSLQAYKNAYPLVDIADVATGLQTGDNNRFVRYWYEVDNSNTIKNVSKESVKSVKERWFPYNKGGQFKKYYGNQELVVNWENSGNDIKNLKSKLLEEGKITANNSKCWNESKYFLPSLSWTKVAYDLSVRYYPQGFGFDVGGCSIFPKEDGDYWFLLALLNSKLTKPLLGPVSPTVNFEPGQLKTYPIIQDRKACSEKLKSFVNEILTDTIVEFESIEINCDFKKLILLSCNGQDIEESYLLYKAFWKNKFSKIRDNEEKINQELIAIYSFSGYVEPKVDFNDITILQEETSIENGELVFHADEVMAQFVSYAVGCMFGRYSLDKPGLILANQGETLHDYLQKLEKQEQDISFLPDIDNIIPLLDDEWFEDDIVARFHEFLKVTFGETNFAKNLAFVEECLGKEMRRYFAKDFYNDHIRRYNKRPIYWMFSSPQGSFNVLIYMHRYTPDTVNNILNKYLREYQEKLRTRREHLDRVEVSGSATEKAKAVKDRARIDQVLLELQEYEREILYPLATDRLAIDLDNGVLVNYNLFGKAVKLVPGLNDPKTKKKVAEFDWVKTAETVI
ncbi:BREX-1 system adenine-specific DNA-methyltransferase PglX [Rufibacter immobilis]|uniref:BREX-1 system adenine-specific DNA-methyltransferase PglX n=1 Tax=Rufibacter immobilis TaxID=1348778 RepID=UPI0035EDD5CE